MSFLVFSPLVWLYFSLLLKCIRLLVFRAVVYDLALLIIVIYFLKKLAYSLQCSIIPILLYFESIIDEGQGVLGHFI